MKKISVLFIALVVAVAGHAQLNKFKNLDVTYAEPRSNQEVSQLAEAIKGNGFPSQRISMLTKAVNDSPLGFTGQQTVLILSAFDTSTKKAEAIKIMDQHILGMNSDNVIEAINTATFSSHKLAILDALRSTITDDDRRYKILDAFKTSIDKKKAKAILDRIIRPRSFIYGTVISKRVVFVVDFSGSMEASFQLSNGNEVNRLEFVTNELMKAVSILPQDTKIDVIMFDTHVKRWKRRLVNATDNNKVEAVRYALNFEPGGATNIYGALEEAFDDKSVKTIYFLTDGVPTTGTETSESGILSKVRSWNSGRNVRIHTCAFLMGNYSSDNKSKSKALMKRLAQENRGVYRAFE